MLSASDQRSHKDHVYAENGVELLKIAALYGANGAGKSNLIKAVAALQRIVLDGGKSSLDELDQFKLGSSELRPTTLEIEYVIDELAYIFGVSVKEGSIVEEWLYQSGFGKKDDQLLFHRKIKGNLLNIQLANHYTDTAEGEFRRKFYQDELLKEDVLLFKELADLKEGFEEVKHAYEWVVSHLYVMFPRSRPDGLATTLGFPSKLNVFANESLYSFHTGIVQIETKTTEIEEFFGHENKELIDDIQKNLRSRKGFMQLLSQSKFGDSTEIIAVLENGKALVKEIVTKHKNSKGELVDFTLDQESDGTNRLLDFIPIFFKAISSPSTVLIDEIDQSIHPALLKELVQKFADNKATKGQLIFTTHESNLLDQAIFRRDEIWFVEKHEGATQLYPLSDFDIRLDLDIRKGYLNGRFGAIPFLGNLANLNWEQYAEA